MPAVANHPPRESCFSHDRSPPRAEHRALRQRAHAAAARRPRRAAGDQARPHHGASVRDVLAAAALRRIRRLRNVDVVAHHRGVARRYPLGGDTGLHHAQILLHQHHRAHGFGHRGAGRPARQAHRRAGISADLGDLVARHPAARIRRACPRHRVVHGAQPRQEPWRGHRLHRPAGRAPQPDPGTTNMGEMLIRGELDGSLHYLAENNLVDRSTVDVSGVTRTLFPDPAAEGRRFYAKTGLFPINHTVVVRRSLLEKHPWIALNLYSAFVAAKEEIARYGQSYLQWYFEAGLLDGNVKRTLAEHDPLAYGFKASRPVLETIARYVHEQGLSARRVELKEIFAPSALDV